MYPEIPSYPDLVQPLAERAQSDPDRPAVVFLLGEEETVITAADLHQGASRYAALMAQLGIGMDDLVILVLQHSIDVIYAFFGALYLGAIPSIFPFLTEKLDPDLYMERVRLLVNHSEAKAIITYDDFKQTLIDLTKNDRSVVLSTGDLPDTEPTDAYPVKVDPEKIAFLQHSSGTTGLQKGVALSHRAVLNQIESYGPSIALNHDRDTICSWLPLYHDMGLIAGFVMPILTGTKLVLMSPFEWVRKPVILMQALDKYQGTLTWLPNFAYNHLARACRPSDLEEVDLSGVRSFINCSEPVRNDSHNKFLEKFMPFGVTPAMLGACYAMAENTFAVTQSLVGNINVDVVEIDALQSEGKAVPTNGEGIEMVSNGPPIPGCEIRIIGEEGETLPERRMGEITLKSNSMLTEYYKRPNVTADAIQDGWYYTGDKGYLAMGELYIAGRTKDIIIVGGKNVYPQDLEDIASGVEGIHAGRVVVFGLFDERIGSEKVILVAELKEDYPEDQRRQIEQDLRLTTAKATEIALADIRLVYGRWVIKTSSGKTARIDNREKYVREFVKK